MLTNLRLAVSGKKPGKAQEEKKNLRMGVERRIKGRPW